MIRSPAAQVGARVYGHQAHQPQQMPGAPCSYMGVALLLEPVRQLNDTKEGMPGVLFIQQSHQGQVLC